MDLQTSPLTLKETVRSVVSERLLARIDANRGVPCFISAPKGYGRTTLAHCYAVSRYDLDAVVWLDGSSQLFNDSIENGEIPELLFRSVSHSVDHSGLVIIDDLPLLDCSAAESLSDSLDRLLESGIQAIVITTPLHDVFETLQSDRMLISGRDLLRSREMDAEAILKLVEDFFAEDLPFEFLFTGMLIVLIQRGCFEDIRSLGYLIRDDVPALLDSICPLFGIDATEQRFSMRSVAVNLIKDRVDSLLSRAVESGCVSATISDSSSFQQLIRIASLLFDRDQKRRSHELLNLAGELTLDLEVVAQPQLHLQPQPQPQPQSQFQLHSSRQSQQPLSSNPPHSAQSVELGSHQKGSAPPLLSIKLLGDLEITLGDTVLDDSLWKRGKVRMLLIHLALNLGRGLARETIMDHLWPDMDIRHATDNFYVTWSRMCRALSGSANHCPYLVSNGMLCRIDNRYVSTDIAEFERLSKQVLFALGSKEERIEAFLQMERLYRGDLLSGCICDDRINGAQQRYRLLLVDAMLSGSQLFSETGHDNNALWFARKAYEIDPTREDVYRVLMDVQNRAGQRTSALQTYFACKKYLDEELGILPSQRTTALYQELILDKH